MYRHRIATKHNDIVLEPQSLTDWLVISPSEGDVVGHIQLFLGVYEVLTKTTPLERAFYDSLDSAIASFTPWEERPETVTPVRPLLHAVISPDAAVA